MAGWIVLGVFAFCVYFFASSVLSALSSANWHFHL